MEHGKESKEERLTKVTLIDADHYSCCDDDSCGGCDPKKKKKKIVISWETLVVKQAVG